MRKLTRRMVWTGVAIVMLGAGYTAGYLLAPPEPRPVSRSLPMAPVEAPAPNIAPDLIEDV